MYIHNSHARSDGESVSALFIHIESVAFPVTHLCPLQTFLPLSLRRKLLARFKYHIQNSSQ